MQKQNRMVHGRRGRSRSASALTLVVWLMCTAAAAAAVPLRLRVYTFGCVRAVCLVNGQKERLEPDERGGARKDEEEKSNRARAERGGGAAEKKSSSGPKRGRKGREKERERELENRSWLLSLRDCVCVLRSHPRVRARWCCTVCPSSWFRGVWPARGSWIASTSARGLCRRRPLRWRPCRRRCSTGSSVHRTNQTNRRRHESETTRTAHCQHSQATAAVAAAAAERARGPAPADCA